MISNTRILLTENLSPYHNLALEELLLEQLPEGQAILYLWRNQHTVVIGAGQNAWRECHTALLEREGGTLARRSSGGGAVYHDLGNLNFSFIVPREDYDLSRQLGVVLEAVRAVGIQAQFTGRNDLTSEGRKFSGNAFRILKRSALHHGTLMVNVDRARVGRYLNVAPAKLSAKGVKSVPSRVVNLSELAPVTVEQLRDSMADAFCRAYGAARPECEAEHIPGLEERVQRYASWEWNYGASPECDVQLEHRFSWGSVELRAVLREGNIASLQVYTDAMDETLHQTLKEQLLGRRWTGEALAQGASAAGAEELAQWLAGQAL